MSERIQKFERHHLPAAAPQEINIGDIEAELKSMWHQEGESAGQEAGAVVRARVANLIVYLAPGESPQCVDEAIDQITLTHPSRALVVASDPSAAASHLDAWVAARCQMPSASGKQVCCEQVSIQASGAFTQQIPSVIAQLLAPDLPVFLWCRGTPHLSDPLITKLMDFADRVVIDSAQFQQPEGDLISLSTLFPVSADWTAITDLNWASLTPRRTLTATFCDVAGYRPYLGRVDRVMVEYVPALAAPDTIAPRAFLFAGWLAHCFGWKHERGATRLDGGGHLFNFEDGNRTVSVVFTPVSRSESLQGTLVSTHMEATTSPSASFIVERSADGTKLQSKSILDGQEMAGRLLGFVELSEPAMLAHELQILGHDHLYEEVVRIAADMAAEMAQA